MQRTKILTELNANYMKCSTMAFAYLHRFGTVKKIPRLNVALPISVYSKMSLANFDKSKHTDEKKLLFKRKFECRTFHWRVALEKLDV